jgi:hypothetical protein
LKIQNDILKNILVLTPELLNSTPLKDKSIAKDDRSKYLKYF